MRIIAAHSLNQNDRRYPVDMLVLHYTGMEDGPSALARMRDEAAEVSAHYMVDTGGEVYQLIDEDKRAWHAGRASWQGDTDLNSRSVGIEIVNGGHNLPLADGSLPPYLKVQIDAVMELSLGIIRRHKIEPSRVVGHSDIAPERKDDPGEHFPWEELADRGIGLWPKPPEADEYIEGIFDAQPLGPGSDSKFVQPLQENLKQIGYGIDVTGRYGELTGKVVTAFQRRWNQSDVSGIADPLTFELVRRVAEMSIATPR